MSKTTKFKYKIKPDLYLGAKKERFVLGSSGENILIVFGVNPSKATNEEGDATIMKVISYAEKNGFNGWLMLNLYPQRDKCPQNLHGKDNEKLHQQNIQIIERKISKIKNPTIWVAWGNTIETRDYLFEHLKEIAKTIEKYKPAWRCVGPDEPDKRLTKHGHPRHPSRMNYAWRLHLFHIKSYLNTHTKQNKK